MMRAFSRAEAAKRITRWTRRPLVGRRDPPRHPMHWRRGRWGRWHCRGEFVIVLHGSHAYKLHRNDVGWIEQRGGEPVTALSEQELVSEMARCGVVGYELSDTDLELIASAF